MGHKHNKRRQQRRERQLRAEQTPHEVREETRDPATRFTNLSARQTKLHFTGNGVRVPVDLDASDAPQQLAGNTLAEALGQGDAEA